MPKMGVPLDASRHRTHTGTEQWQSFEIRMRHRRAERCLLRAQAALDAGLEAEARAALDEARGLNPDTPPFDELLAAARLRREADAAKVRRQRTRRAALVAVAGLIVSLGIGWAVFEQRDTPSVETVATLPEPSPPSVAQATTGTKPPEADRPPPPQDSGVERPPGRPDVAPGVEPETPAPPTVPAPPPPPVARERIAERRASDPRPPTSADTPRSPPPTTPAPPKTPAPTTTESIASPAVDTSLTPGALGAPLTAAMKAPAPPPEAVPAPEPASAAPEPVSQEPAVRAVLARFAEAYSSLSASAARQVWPSVDARSLSRAFEGLESQQVSLGNCNVKVAASTARAECSGSATWTPKIGGGRRSEARRWEFDLARSNDGWLIVQARAR